jgi:hypothetical protein
VLAGTICLKSVVQAGAGIGLGGIPQGKRLGKERNILIYGDFSGKT